MQRFDVKYIHCVFYTSHSIFLFIRAFLLQHLKWRKCFFGQRRPYGTFRDTIDVDGRLLSKKKILDGELGVKKSRMFCLYRISGQT